MTCFPASCSAERTSRLTRRPPSAPIGTTCGCCTWRPVRPRVKSRQALRSCSTSASCRRSMPCATWSARPASNTYPSSAHRCSILTRTTVCSVGRPPVPDRQAEMRQMLRALRLLAIAALYADLALKAAKANLTHEAFLYELVRAECTQRDEHRVARLQRLSGLPPDKTFRTLQLEKFPPLIREQLERLRSGAFLDDAINVVAAGKPGVGKSHALAAIGNELR